MALKIYFLDDATAVDLCRGEIVLNNFVERFEAPLSFWSASQYKKQWSEGLRRIIDGDSRSCLITSMYDPKKANFIVWWPMYRYPDRIVVQNQILFMNKLPELFDPSDPYRFIGEHVSIGDEGEPVSEWFIDPGTLQPV